MITLLVDLGTRCNLRCVHCSSASGPHGEPVDERCIETVRRYLDGGLVTALQLTGGEPLMVPGLEAILAACDRAGVPAVVNTNLTLPAPERWLAHERTRFMVSLDGPTAEVHDAVRGPRAFARTYDNLLRLIGAGHRDRIGLNYTCMTLNQGSAGGMVELAARLGVRLDMADTWLVGRGHGLQQEPDAFFGELLAAGRRAVELGYDQMHVMVAPRTRALLEALSGYGNFHVYRCNAGVTKAYVGADGRVMPCIKSHGREGVAGPTLSGVFLSPSFRDFRAAAFGAERQVLFEETCAGCSFRKDCTPCVYDRARWPSVCLAGTRRAMAVGGER